MKFFDRNWRFFSLAVILLSVWAMLIGLHENQALAEETVYLGSHFALTGPAALWGTPSLPGLKMAVEEVNAAGGFKVKDKTYKIKLLEADNEGKAEQAVAVVNKQLAEYHPPIVFGPTISTTAAPVVEMCKSRKDFIVIGAASILGKMAEDAHKAGIPLVFRTTPPNELTAPEQVDYFADQMGIKSIAMIVADDEIGHQIVDLEFLPQFKRRGIKVTDVLYFPRETQDFYAFLSRVKPNKPDAIFAAYLDTHVQGIIRQALELKITKTFINRGGSTRGALPFKDQIDNYITQMFIELDLNQDPKIVDWKQRYAKRFGRPPDNGHNDSAALFYYDFLFTAIQAMQKAGTVSDIQAISKALHATDYNGVLGKITYDQYGRSLWNVTGAHVHKGGKITTFVIHPRADLLLK
jgi:branched-chain amino acid transport system substrate-binding protein